MAISKLKQRKKMKKAITALLVIDAQRIYTDPQSELFCKNSDKTLSNINRLIKVFLAIKNPIVFIRHVHALDGSDLGRMFDYAGEFEDFNFKSGSPEVEYAPDLKRQDGVTEITKTRYSAFQKTDLDSILRKKGVTRIVVCGFMTNFCCESTAREAHDRDYYVTFIPDATGCPELPRMPQKRIREVVGALLEAGFATVTSTSDFIRKLKER